MCLGMPAFIMSHAYTYTYTYTSTYVHTQELLPGLWPVAGLSLVLHALLRRQWHLRHGLPSGRYLASCCSCLCVYVCMCVCVYVFMPRQIGKHAQNEICSVTHTHTHTHTHQYILLALRSEPPLSPPSLPPLPGEEKKTVKNGKAAAAEEEEKGEDEENGPLLLLGRAPVFW